MRQKPRLALLFSALCCAANTALASDGDLNISGEVNAADVLWSQQTLAGSRVLTPEQFIKGDVAPLVGGIPQPDGLFNAGDATIITRIALGLLNFSLVKNQFNVGDSIGEGEAANGTIGEPNHQTVWSTGYNGGDIVNSFNERFEAAAPASYYENNASRDPIFNHAVSGATMADFSTQALNVIAATASTPSGKADMVSVLLGNNDVCATSIASMTDPASFETQYRAGLDVLAANDTTKKAQIHVSGLPAIYWLWESKRNDFWCRVIAWPFVPCENLLDNPTDDCASATSRQDPDNVYPGDGSNCQRRKEFHAQIRDTYNPILRDVLAEYRNNGDLPNARYTDVFNVRFQSSDVNGGDCFHPSTAGHALFATEGWCETHWANNDPACSN
jgi:lysophospholipase L1-like esterase